MHKVYYPISGVSTTAATGYVAVRGMENFTVGFFSSGTVAAPATGTITLQGALTPNFPYFNIYSTNIVNATYSGVYTQFSGPFESLNALYSGTNGTFSVVVLAKYNAQI